MKEEKGLTQNKEKIETGQAPRAIGTYSQAIKVATTVFLSGQIPLDPKTMVLVSDDITLQTNQVFSNLTQVCQAAGGSLNSIVKLTIYLTDLAHFSVVNEIMETLFHPPYPARTTIQVSALPKLAQIEVDAIMILN